MNNPLVSIVLPTYNGSRYLAQSIESCLSQTYRDIELIIVNDCSTDETSMIAENFALKDNRVLIINNKINQRLPRSLNIGFAASKGEFLTWTSDDNCYQKNAIEIMINLLRNKPEVGLVYADMWLVDDTGDIQGYNRNILFNGAVSDLPIYNAVGACFMYRRSVSKVVGEYNAEKELVEDWDYWFRIWLRFQIKHIPHGIYFYRKHIESLTEKRYVEQQIKTIDFILGNNIQYDDIIPDDIKCRAYLKCAGIARRLNNRDLAKECMKLALAVSAEAREYTSKELVEYATV